MGVKGWRLNCGAGDLLMGLNQADLEMPLGQLVERVAAEMAGLVILLYTLTKESTAGT